MILVIAFLLLVSLVVTTVLAALGKFLGDRLPGGVVFWHISNSLISLGVITVLFGLIFKVLPDVKLSWRDVGVGALVTAILFTIGKFLIGLYLGQGSIASAYGAAGSFVVLLIWIYYSSQILLFGAEITRAYSGRRRQKPLEAKVGCTLIDQKAA
jgi:membrane protein